MTPQPFILAVVPARGGSKGIPLKNLSQIAQRSLLQITLELIQQTPQISDCVVSTDHPQIAAEAERLGVAVPFLRPENLSGDLVGDLPVLQHAVRTYEDLHKQKVDVILMLQPTCPLRTSKHVTDCIDLLLSSGTDSVWTVTQVSPKYHPLKQLVITGGKMRLSDADGSKIVARQQLEPSYIRNGVCYAWRRAPLMEISDFLPLNSQALVISEEIVNIDTAEDLERARSLLSREA